MRDLENKVEANRQERYKQFVPWHFLPLLPLVGDEECELNYEMFKFLFLFAIIIIMEEYDC